MAVQPKSGANRSKLWFLLWVPLISIFVNYVYTFLTIDAPPSDFGSGQMFDAIANRYDMINRVLAFRMDVGWRKRMVQIIKTNTGDSPRLLDVATGTADVALLLANAIPQATVIGIDPSHNMLKRGRDKVKMADLNDRIQLIEGDSRKLSKYLPSPDKFDAATMAFGIRNVPERQDALCEIHKSLKPDATFCILEFSEPPKNTGFIRSLARFFIRKVVPILGGILSGAPREYLHLQNSIQDFPSPQEFVRLLGSLECDTGGFHVQELIQLNFDSVQLYVMKKREGATK